MYIMLYYIALCCYYIYTMRFIVIYSVFLLYLYQTYITNYIYIMISTVMEELMLACVIDNNNNKTRAWPPCTTPTTELHNKKTHLMIYIIRAMSHIKGTWFGFEARRTCHYK